MSRRKKEIRRKFRESVFERDGREIINCTEGGALEIFRRSDLEQEISKSTNFQN